MFAIYYLSQIVIVINMYVDIGGSELIHVLNAITRDHVVRFESSGVFQIGLKCQQACERHVRNCVNRIWRMETSAEQAITVS